MHLGDTNGTIFVTRYNESFPFFFQRRIFLIKFG